MRAFGVTTSSRESFVVFEAEKPVLRPHDILVEVAGVSVNPVDKWIRKAIRGRLTEPKILGWDGIGRVVELGSAASLFKVGDRVFWAGDVTRAGSNAEFQAIDERIVGFAPKKLTAAEAVALPLTALTAYEALFERMKIDAQDRGKSILIISGAGGVGSIAVQLAKKVAGLRVIATASSEEAVAWVRRLSADEVVDHHQNLIKQVRGLGLEFVDYVLILNDPLGHLKEVAELIAPQGRIANIVEPKEPLDLKKLAHKSASFSFEWMFTKAVSNTTDIQSQHEILNKVAGWLDDGTLQTTLTRNFGELSVGNLREAHRAIETGHTIGKIVLVSE